MASDQQASFQLALDSASFKGSAVDAAKALQDLQKQLSEDKKAVNELQGAMKNLQGASVVNVAQFRTLQDALKKKQEAVASAQSSIIGLGGSLKRTKTSAFRDGLKGIAGEAKLAGGPLGQMFGRVENLTKLAGTGAVKYVALAGAVAAVGAAGIYAAKSLFDLAFASSEARREENLQLQGQLSLTKGITDTQAASEDLQETIDQVSGRSAASRAAIVGLGKDLYAAGLRGGALEEALDAAATTAAVQGPAAADKFVKLAAATDKAGGSVSKLAQKVDKDLGGIAQQKLLSTAVQAEKFKEAVGSLFAGVRVDGLLKARKGWTDMFSTASASGRAFKALLEPISQSLVDGVTSWTELLQKAVVRVLIWAIKIEIGWLKLKRMFFGLVPKDLFDGFNGKAVLIAGVASALIAVGIALAPMIASAAVAAAPFVLAAAAIWAVINTTRLLIDLWNEMDFSAVGKQLYKDLIQPIIDFADKAWNAAMDVGGKIIEGIVNGVKSGAHFLIDALTNLGATGWKAFKTVLGIASPSKEFAQLGKQIPAGVKQGIDAGKPQVDESLVNLVDPSLAASNMNVGNPALQGAGAAAAGQAGAISSTSTSTTNHFEFNISGSDSKQIAQDVEEMIRRLFSVTAQQMGAT